MVTFTGTLTNINGVTISVSGTPNVVTDASPTVFGVVPDTSSGMTSVTADIAVFPHNRFSRVYGATTCPQWTDSTVKALAVPGTTLAFSAKTFSVAEYISNWDAMPAGTTVHEYTPFHECNRPANKGAPDPVAWKSFMTQLLAARNAHKNKARIQIGPNFSWFPAAVGHNEATPWVQFMTDASGKPYPYDFISWDQYAVSSTNPDNPVTFTSLPRASGESWHLPVEIWETGIGSGGSDSMAAQWLLSLAAQYRTIGARRAAYWNSGSYKLNSRPASLSAWKSLL